MTFSGQLSLGNRLQSAASKRMLENKPGRVRKRAKTGDDEKHHREKPKKAARTSSLAEDSLAYFGTFTRTDCSRL